MYRGSNYDDKERRRLLRRRHSSVVENDEERQHRRNETAATAVASFSSTNEDASNERNDDDLRGSEAISIEERDVASRHEDENVTTVERTQTHCRSILERAMMSSEYARVRLCDRMRFQDLRARLFGLARTFDPDNSRTVCDLVRSLTVDYLTSLYDISYRSFCFFDTASGQICSLIPVTLAAAASTVVDGCTVATTDWLTRRTIENFCRVHFYRMYEYLRCYELRRIILLEAFDRNDYCDYVTNLFLRQNESLARQREATVALWKKVRTRRLRATATTTTTARIVTVAKVVRCVQIAERSLRTVDAVAIRSDEPTNNDGNKSEDRRLSSLDFVLAAAIQRAAVRENDNGQSSSSSSLLEQTASVWPSWNLPLSRYATSMAKAHTVGSVDERIDIIDGGGGVGGTNNAASWSYISSESYDYMTLYRQNSQCDRRIIRGDANFYTNLFCTLFDVIEE